jgi:hypothetical protein
MDFAVSSLSPDSFLGGGKQLRKRVLFFQAG